MGELAEAFRAALLKADYDVLPMAVCNRKPLATTKDLPEPARAEIVDLHRALGGVAGYLDFASGKWDFATADGLFIEFDEQLHFNRYRGTTDRLTWSRGIPWATAYGQYCATHDDQCLKAGSYGGKWTSPSTEKMFGKADPPGVLGKNGSPRWKQRALYDAVKDACAVHRRGISLARVSLHDEIGGLGVHQALKPGGSGLDPVALRDFVAHAPSRDPSDGEFRGREGCHGLQEALPRLGPFLGEQVQDDDVPPDSFDALGGRPERVPSTVKLKRVRDVRERWFGGRRRTKPGRRRARTASPAGRPSPRGSPSRPRRPG